MIYGVPSEPDDDAAWMLGTSAALDQTLVLAQAEHDDRPRCWACTRVKAGSLPHFANVLATRPCPGSWHATRDAFDEYMRRKG